MNILIKIFIIAVERSTMMKAHNSTLVPSLDLDARPKFYRSIMVSYCHDNTKHQVIEFRN